MSEDKNKPGVPERVRINREQSCQRRTNAPDDVAPQQQAAARALGFALPRCSAACMDRTLA
ncbi:hypothetical protein ABE493_00635 [Stenotrophomonas terrae]|uniref:hypothetical protein n=1 Tax=Stenotrophomonas terrae TaxID=405446 RepID=UPI0032095C67